MGFQPVPPRMAQVSLATRSGVPWRLVYFEKFDTRAEAVRRERELKTGKGRDDLKRILEQQTQEIGE